MMYVIGSGPAGVACAKALLERGLSVCLLDAGIELEVEKQELLNKIQHSWDESIIASFKQTLLGSNPLKRSYNSDYIYSPVENFYDLLQHKAVSCHPSFAKGGLSNVWGGFVQDYKLTDLVKWPEPTLRFQHYYPVIDSMLKSTNKQRLSPQAQIIYHHLNHHQDDLQTAGFEFGRATLAVDFKSKLQGCIYCGLCQHGCPMQLIYSAKFTLKELQQFPNFTYIQNIVVEAVQETDKNITIVAYNRISSEALTFSAQQVFCACGPVISSYIWHRSTKRSNRNLDFIDSSHFILPLLMHTRISGVEKRSLHTLCQLFFKIQPGIISIHNIHLQLYSYMDFYTQRLQQSFKQSYKYLSPLFNHFVNKLLMIQGYLHSEESHHFSVAMNHKTLQLIPKYNPAVKLIIPKLLRYLKKHKHLLGMRPIASLFKMSAIARSFHYGGSMPMKLTPINDFDTDIWGRPLGFKRFHIIDAAIFPSIPAGSITHTVMANAYRIGKEINFND